jgi:hypothetical protein
MSNARVTKFYGIREPFLANVLDLEERCNSEYFSGLKTFFTNYRNPIGIEVEAENYFGPKSGGGLSFWEMKGDGSLKIKGIEFVSHILSGRQIDCALYELQKFLGNHNEGMPLLWSNRTSIHVHLNVSTLTLNQLKALVGLYALFEDLYFSMVEAHRKGNPYCFNVVDTDPVLFNSVIPESKYCALNLAPIRQFGTIEFRHLHGTEDFKLIRRWIQMVVKLHKFVMELPTEEAISIVKSIIASETFINTFKQIYGATSILFTEPDIFKSARRGAPWAAIYLEQPIE